MKLGHVRVMMAEGWLRFDTLVVSGVEVKRQVYSVVRGVQDPPSEEDEVACRASLAVLSRDGLCLGLGEELVAPGDEATWEGQGGTKISILYGERIPDSVRVMLEGLNS